MEEVKCLDPCGVKRNRGQVESFVTHGSGGDGQATTWMWAPRPGWTPIVRAPRRAIIGLRWVTSQDWASPAGWRSGGPGAPRSRRREAVHYRRGINGDGAEACRRQELRASTTFPARHRASRAPPSLGEERWSTRVGRLRGAARDFPSCRWPRPSRKARRRSRGNGHPRLEGFRRPLAQRWPGFDPQAAGSSASLLEDVEAAAKFVEADLQLLGVLQGRDLLPGQSASTCVMRRRRSVQGLQPAWRYGLQGKRTSAAPGQRLRAEPPGWSCSARTKAALSQARSRSIAAAAGQALGGELASAASRARTAVRRSVPAAPAAGPPGAGSSCSLFGVLAPWRALRSAPRPAAAADSSLSEGLSSCWATAPWQGALPRPASQGLSPAAGSLSSGRLLQGRACRSLPAVRCSCDVGHRRLGLERWRARCFKGGVQQYGGGLPACAGPAPGPV